MNMSLKQIRTPVALIGLMLATRFHHFGGVISLPDASLAAFFFAGFWVSGWRFFAILLVEAALIDNVAIAEFGVSDYCISPAYAFLIPAYACLWFAGRYCADRALKPSELIQQFVALVIATSTAFVISNGSFYVLSGKISDINWLHYGDQMALYYPPYLAYTLMYVTVIYVFVNISKSMLSNSINTATSQ